MQTKNKRSPSHSIEDTLEIVLVGILSAAGGYLLGTLVPMFGLWLARQYMYRFRES